MARALLTWFADEARALPWRRTLDPYAIWVSEIMLQQTQVKTVIPYWQRWLRQLPTIRALADAEPDQVLKLWEGLGYYTRARHLHAAARQLVQEHSGEFPTQFDDILRLPGIGLYTAGAIASIAFNQPRPILDGNVIRVLTRLYGVQESPRERATTARLWEFALALVTAAGAAEPVRRARSPAANGAVDPRGGAATGLKFAGACSQLNQALMELGAMLCTPRQPECKRCPLRRCCTAHATGQVDSLPNLARRAPTTARRFIAFVLEDRGRWLVRRRPAGCVNGGLWEFPNVEVTGPEPPQEGLSRLAARVAGGNVRRLQPLLTVRHSITRYRIQLEAFRGLGRASGPAAATEPANSQLCWLPLAKLEQLAFAGAHRKVLTSLRAAGRAR